MKDKLIKLIVAAHNAGLKFYEAAKRDVIRFEVWLKSVAAVAIGGGVSTISDIYQHGKAFELSAAHLLELKAKFISGAAVALFAYWAKSPVGKDPKQ